MYSQTHNLEAQRKLLWKKLAALFAARRYHCVLIRGNNKVFSWYNKVSSISESSTLQEERRSAMNLCQESSSNSRTQTSYEAPSTNSCTSAPLQNNALSGIPQRPNKNRPEVWPQQASSHMLPDWESGIDTSFRRTNEANGAAAFGRRLDHQNRTVFNYQSTVENAVGRRQTARRIFVCTNQACRPLCSLGKRRLMMAFRCNEFSFKRPLLLRVGLQTTRCLLQQGL